MASSRSLSSSLKKLDISQSAKTNSNSKGKQPADSWEDEAEASSDTETEKDPQPLKSPQEDLPGTPPPTPASPSFSSDKPSTGVPYQTFPPSAFDSTPDKYDSSKPPRTGQRDGEAKRPETSMTVASRLIAHGLGQKPPKRTQEQREYESAVRAQERKRREAVKEEEMRKKKEKEKALRDVWED